MPITDDRIATLKREYSSKIEDALAQVEVWKGIVSQFKTKLSVLNELVIDSTSGGPTPQERSFGASMGKYANLSTTPAVLAVLLDAGHDALAAGDIIKILENEGFDASSKHWKNAVFTACRRLSDKGIIVGFEKDGRKLYMRP